MITPDPYSNVSGSLQKCKLRKAVSEPLSLALRRGKIDIYPVTRRTGQRDYEASLSEERSARLGREKIPGLLLRLSLPAVVASLSTVAYSLVDAVFIGRLGTSARALHRAVWGEGVESRLEAMHFVNELIHLESCNRLFQTVSPFLHHRDRFAICDDFFSPELPVAKRASPVMHR